MRDKVNIQTESNWTLKMPFYNRIVASNIYKIDKNIASGLIQIHFKAVWILLSLENHSLG